MNKEVTFTVVRSAYLIDQQDGTHFSLTGFRASDGAALSLIQHEFASPVDAQEYFNKLVARSATVLTRGQKKDKSGRVLGIRAQVTFHGRGTGPDDQAILWTHGANLYQIISPSLKDALAFEKKYANQ